jgi:uncharacterized DUF497 family protein
MMIPKDFQWDPAKARANLLKHGVAFAEAVIAIEDPYSRHMLDPDAEGESRFIALGMDGLGRILITVYAYRNETIRIISARRASRNERAKYEEYL